MGPTRCHQLNILRATVVGVSFLALLAIQQAMLMSPPTLGPPAMDVLIGTLQSAKKLGSHESYSDDEYCPFRNSSIYRKVYVYPTPGDKDWAGRSDNILSDAGRRGRSPPWPWVAYDRMARANSSSHYDIDGQHVQYTTELLVRELMVNPKSCLRTNDPEEATLFYVPYLPSVEFHRGNKYEFDYSFSPFGKAIMDIVQDNNYSMWEATFGLTSQYWRRRNGSDHILVFSEPMHGLYHPRNKRGNFHYLHSQKQLTPPIVISVELSTTFVETYPKCAAKNILMPYPNTDGRWFNGVFDREAHKILFESNLTAATSAAALATEKSAAMKGDPNARPAALYLDAGVHGTCKWMRHVLRADYEKCSKSHSIFHVEKSRLYRQGMRLSTFCPSPGGDSPSAKRMFDCCFAGAIPVVISHDFVWPFTKEADPEFTLGADAFSLRFNATDFLDTALDGTTCKHKDDSKLSLEAKLEKVPAAEIKRLRDGVAIARKLYAWYKEGESLVDNPLRSGILPDGQTAHKLVKELEKRALGARWPACQQELASKNTVEDARKFKC